MTNSQLDQIIYTLNNDHLTQTQFLYELESLLGDLYKSFGLQFTEDQRTAFDSIRKHIEHELYEK